MSGLPWGGSEVLWSQVALRLYQQGHTVMASVHRWPKRAAAIEKLREAGLDVVERESDANWAGTILRIKNRVISQWSGKVTTSGGSPRDAKCLDAFRPDVVCVSHGAVGCGLAWMEYALAASIPYVSVAHANAEWFWPDDERAERLGRAHAGAVATCFVSQGNLRLFEMQVAIKLNNALVVRNPVMVERNKILVWPSPNPEWRLACVGRLSFQKGLDLVLQVLALPTWKDRALKVSFYGDGPSERSLRRLARMLNVEAQITFQGHTESILDIWQTHHALLLPSRCEGLPLALIEALMLGRTAIATDVAGHKEVIKDDETGFIAGAPTLELLNEAMERAWQRRGDWQDMGKAGAAAIRELIPMDPVSDFSQIVLSAAEC